MRRSVPPLLLVFLLAGCAHPVLVRQGVRADAVAEQSNRRPTTVETCGGVRYDRVDVRPLGPDSLVVADGDLALDTLALDADVRSVRISPRPSRAPYYVAGGVVALGVVSYFAPVSCKAANGAEEFGCAVGVGLVKSTIIPASMVAGLFYGSVTAAVLRLRPAYEYRYGCAAPPASSD